MLYIYCVYIYVYIILQTTYTNYIVYISLIAMLCEHNYMILYIYIQFIVISMFV